MASPEAARRIMVCVVYSPGAGVVEEVELQLEAGAVLADALAASGLLQRHGLAAAGLPVGVWGRRAPLTAGLRDRDRVEIYRPLLIDPKEARRTRQRQQRGLAAGR